jgi:hypothetical protein
MDLPMILVLLAVISSWTVLGLTIRRWGPGHARRWVRCPEHRKRAKVGVEQREGDFGRLRVADITDCSLHPGTPLPCDKDCLRQL